MPVQDRLLHLGVSAQKKVQEMQALKSIHELDGCTFSPQICKYKPSPVIYRYYITELVFLLNNCVFMLFF